MNIYLQGPDGEEIELEHNAPDPDDGTRVVPVDQVISYLEHKDNPGEFWIRIVKEG